MKTIAFLITIMTACTAAQPLEPDAQVAAAELAADPSICSSVVGTGRVATTRHLSLIGGVAHGGFVDIRGTWVAQFDGDTYDLPLPISSGDRIEQAIAYTNLNGSGISMGVSIARKVSVFGFNNDIGDASTSTNGESTLVVSPNFVEDCANGESTYELHFVYSRQPGSVAGSSGVGAVQLTTSVLAATGSTGC